MDAIFQRGYGLIIAVSLIYAVLIAVMNLIVDVAYAWIDPASAQLRSPTRARLL